MAFLYAVVKQFSGISIQQTLITLYGGMAFKQAWNRHASYQKGQCNISRV